MFPPYEWTRNGSTQSFADNFIIGNANPESAIFQCLELVDDPSKITIDVLLLGNMKNFEAKAGHSSRSWSKDHDAAIANLMRGRDIRYQFNNSNSIVQTIRAFPSVNWRYILQQDDANSGIDMIKFDGSFTWPLQEAGR